MLYGSVGMMTSETTFLMLNLLELGNEFLDAEFVNPDTTLEYFSDSSDNELRVISVILSSIFFAPANNLF